MKSYAVGAVLLILLTIAGVSAHALTLDQYLEQVQEKHHGLKALEKSREAATDRRDAGDIELSPVLLAHVTKVDDRKPQPFGTFILDREETSEYFLGISKKFSTGTQAQISGQLDDQTMTATDLSQSPPATLSEPFATSSLGISLSQSLWKDAFGRATGLRHEREAAIEANEKQSYDLQARQIMVDAESAFWDYLYQEDEVNARKDSLDRAEKIESWIHRRVGNGIGDEADLYDAQGLVASRQLQLLAAQNDLRAAEKKIRDALELVDADPTPKIQGDVALNRSVDQMLPPGGHGHRVRLDAYLSVLDAKTRAISAAEVEDAYRPDLVLTGGYNTNSLEYSARDAYGHIADTDKPTTSIGLKLSWALDSSLKEAVRGTARAEALSAALKKERALLESDSAWSELKRQHDELAQQIEAATRVDQLQTKKASAQRNKLNKGRAITTDVIIAEQDAAEAHLNLNKLRAAQRKLEAQARLYVTMEE